jgi:hypothetical protein
LVGVAERDCLLAALARLRPVRRRNRFYIISAAYVTLHILFNHATSPMKLSAATTKVLFVFDPTPYMGLVFLVYRWDIYMGLVFLVYRWDIYEVRSKTNRTRLIKRQR